MPKRIRARPKNWVLLVAGMSVILGGLVVATALKPLPSYLVAISNIPTGSSLAEANIGLVELELGDLAENYATEEDLNGEQRFIAVVGPGELIPRRLLGQGLLPEQTSLRFNPDLKPAESIVAGSAVSVWQVVETEEGFMPQRIVAVSEVLAITYGEGLFAEEFPDVELLVNTEQSTLLISAVAAGYPIYVLPLP
ncbi:MAG: hypothetical protein P8M68_03620 [Aquiluna sp.]|nr:hypothetical protein [Aquiluna sp.]